MKIYFAGSIRGGRNDAEIYALLIKHIQKFGEVLTEHVGNPNIKKDGEGDILDHEIYNRDMSWLNESKAVIAECTAPSLGVGYELREAVVQNKYILVLHRLSGLSGKKLSAMINGCEDIMCVYYETLDEAQNIINRFFELIMAHPQN